MSMLRIGSRLFAAAVLVSVLVGVMAQGATAEGTRVLDPRLSLVGGCVNEELDPVEDPGCPNTPPPGSHPLAPFAYPHAVATDPYGNVYVANRGGKEDGTEGRIDIFTSAGYFISEIPKGVVVHPEEIAVDSTGDLYVWSEENEALQGKLFRFDPCAPYNPAAGEIDYCEPPVAVPLVGPECAESTLCGYRETFGPASLAVNPENDHLFYKRSGQIVEYSSAAEGNEELRMIQYHATGPDTGSAIGMAIDASRHRLYAQEGTVIGIYELVSGLPVQEEYERTGVISPSVVPAGTFGSSASLAVDEGTGNLFVYDTENTHLFELDEDGNYLATVAFPLLSVLRTGIAVDNGASSPNGKLGEEEGGSRYLYVPSHQKKTPGHLFAFFASRVDPPDVKTITAANVSEDEAELQSQINPGNLSTTYSFELKPAGSADWTQVGSGTIAAGNLDVEVSAAATGLAPGAHYVFRVVASNEEGPDEAEGSFATYPRALTESNPCDNALLRTGVSAQLPDCRAYELVTPADTNGRIPLGALGEGGGSSTRQVSPAGDKVTFRIEGGSLPGFNATGSLIGDPYLATRTATGWTTSLIGPTGAETLSDAPGTTSPDLGYSFWGAAEQGPAVLEGRRTFYVRYPDGHSELVGQGSLGIEPGATGHVISDGAGHIIFSTESPVSPNRQLEPDAAPSGTKAIYDRTSDGSTHVISLKPGNIPFSAGENAKYLGASPDGEGVVFEVGEEQTVYLRYHDEVTYKIGDKVRYAGIAEGGGRVFYLEGGDLKAFDVASGNVIVFADTPDAVIPVMVSADGSTAYFVSESPISGSGPNPEGSEPQAGGQNLYRSKEGQITLVGTVTNRDVVGSSEAEFDGLGLWLAAVGTPPTGFGQVPARSTPDGGVFLFKSRASLTEYNSEGHAEIYLFNATTGQLRCLSCNPTGAPAESEATLQSTEGGGSDLFRGLVWPENLRADGRRAFFESTEALVSRDADGLQDIYEWEDQGVGSCTQPGGCLYLISSPNSRRNEFLWAVSRSGDDVFFRSSDLLVGADADETPSIYDARVGGGFPEASPASCEGEGCRTQLTPSPPLPAGETPVRGAGDNVKAHACGKGKHKVKRGGKVRCVKKKRHRKHHHHRAGAGQKGGR
jgi:hypothetical protein